MRSGDAGLRKTVFLRHLDIKTIILPRQARDKHRKTQKKMPFFAPSLQALAASRSGSDVTAAGGRTRVKGLVSSRVNAHVSNKACAATLNADRANARAEYNNECSSGRQTRRTACMSVVTNVPTTPGWSFARSEEVPRRKQFPRTPPSLFEKHTHTSRAVTAGRVRVRNRVKAMDTIRYEARRGSQLLAVAVLSPVCKLAPAQGVVVVGWLRTAVLWPRTF